MTNNKEINKLENLKEKRFKSVTESLDEIYDMISSKNYDPISTGFLELDKKLGGGLLTQSIATIGGAPSIGKTTFALNLAYHLAASRPVFYISIEMPLDQLITKLGALILKLDPAAKNQDVSALELRVEINKNGDKKEEHRNIFKNNKNLHNLYLLYSESRDFMDIKKTMDEIVKNYGLNESPIIFVDYLQLISTNAKIDFREHMKNVSGYFKNVANKHNTIVFQIIANNREANKEGNASSLNSGRDTSDIEYSADYYFQLNFSNWEYIKKDYMSRSELLIGDKRYVTLAVHKARSNIGAGEKINFVYNPRNDFFSPTGPYDESKDRWKGIVSDEKPQEYERAHFSA